jgi:glutathione S-transferase
MELDAHTLYIIRRHNDLAHLYGKAPEALRAARDGFNKQIRWAEMKLGDREYAVGDSFSGVDILLTSCLDWAHAYDFELADNLNEYRATLHERPAYKTAAALNFSVSAGA